MDAVYVSPPWGGVGYHLLPEYTLDLIYPDIDQILKKCLSFSKNLILFLPKNTSIDDLLKHLIPFAQSLANSEERPNEMQIEIEEVIYSGAPFALHVMTGELSRIEPREAANYFYNKFCNSNYSSQ